MLSTSSFQEHISSNPPQKVLSVDEFLSLRREVLQMLKQYDQPTAVVDDTAPGEEVEAPPGEEPDEQPVIVSKYAQMISQLQLITEHVLTAYFMLQRS
jgi:pre-mRNA-processing factor 39